MFKGAQWWHVEEAVVGDTGPGETSGPGYTFVTMKKHQFVERDLPKWNPELQAGASHLGQSTAFLDTDICSVLDALHPDRAETLTHFALS